MTSRPFLAVLALAATGCGSGGDDDSGPVLDTSFVIANEIYTADSSTTYINVLGSLDNVAIDPGRAVEFAGGRATIATHAGWLFVAPPDRPVITRYAISDTGALVAEGEISFANYGLEFVYIDEWALTFISATKAYLTNFDDGSIIVWNPTTMELTGEIPPLQSLVRPNLSLNNSGTVVRGNRMFQIVFWSDWEAYATSTEQYLAVYDTDTDTNIALVPEQRCPGLSNRVDRDEAGNLYFSNWVWNVSETLIRGAPSSCALRIPPDAETFDPAWIHDFRQSTEGREAAMYAYLGDGKGLLNVFHSERVTYDGNSDPAELAQTPNWRLWSVDAAGGVGAPVEGSDWMTGGASTFHLDGRAFVFTPSADYATTQISEIVDGRSVPAFEVAGWSYQFFQVR